MTGQKTASGLSLAVLKGGAGNALAKATELPEVLNFMDLAEAAKALAQTAKQKLYAEEWHLRGQRKAGGLLPPEKGGRGKRSQAAKLSIDPDSASRWREVASVTEDVFESFVETARTGEDITRAGLLRFAGNGHRLAPLMSSAEEDWHTPREVIDAVLAVFGRIDLDPCCNVGTPNVPATRHFRPKDDGLSREWTGNVYMNPPYGRTIGTWVEKLCTEYTDGSVTGAVALIPARTDTAWFRLLHDQRVCFVAGRLRFSGADPAPFPSAAAYFGGEPDAFTAAFADLGDSWERVS